MVFVRNIWFQYGFPTTGVDKLLELGMGDSIPPRVGHVLAKAFLVCGVRGLHTRAT